jgi:hypothetical protein
MINPEKTAFTCPYAARQFVMDCSDRFTLDEAFTAIRSDMLLGHLPVGSFGLVADETFRQAAPDEYPDDEAKDEYPELVEYTPAQVLQWLAEGGDSIAKRWWESRADIEEACRQVARSTVPAAGQSGRRVNEVLGLNRAGVRAFYSRREVPPPRWAADGYGAMQPKAREQEEAAPSTSPRRTRRRDAGADAMRKNKIEAVRLAAGALRRRSEVGKTLSPEALAAELVNSGKAQGFKAETLRQIIRGTYRPMKVMGIKGSV